MTSGDEFDLSRFEVIKFDCDKTNIKGKERYSTAKKAVTDVFNSPDKKITDVIRYPGEFTLVAQDLLDSSKSTTTAAYQPLNFQATPMKQDQSFAWISTKIANLWAM